MGMQIAFVCSGNTCRSPMAQGLFLKLLREKGRTDVGVYSCGTAAFTGDNANPKAIEAAKELGVDISQHRSRQASAYLLGPMDQIVCMTAAQADDIRRLMPDKQVTVLGGGIADPYGGDLQVYRACAKQIWAALQAFYATLPPETKENEA